MHNVASAIAFHPYQFVIFRPSDPCKSAIDRVVQIVLPPARVEHVCTFFGKELGRRQRHSRGCSGDHRHFTSNLPISALLLIRFRRSKQSKADSFIDRAVDANNRRTPDKAQQSDARIRKRLQNMAEEYFDPLAVIGRASEELA
jgi:hypothetical protein